MAQLDEARTISDTVAAHVSDHNQLHTKANYVFDVTDFGALGDGTTDDTVAFAAVAAAAGDDAVVLFPTATYLIDPGTTFGDRVIIVGNGSTIKRRSNGTDKLLEVGDFCTVRDLKLNGNQDSLGNSTNAERGLFTGKVPTLVNIESYDHYSQGVYVEGDGSTAGGLLSNVYGHDNGPGTSADGIYILNSVALRGFGLRGKDNARWGVTVTTFSGGGVDATLSVGVTLSGVRATGNTSGPMDLEGITDCGVSHVYAEDGNIVTNSSLRTSLSQITAPGITSSSPHIKIIDAYLTGNAEALSITGNSPTIANVVCEPAGAPTGNLAPITPGDGDAHLSDIRIVDCNNGFVITKVGTGFFAKNLQVDATDNVRYKITHDGQTESRPTGEMLDIDAGVFIWRAAAAPVAQYWAVGDIVYDTAPAAAGTIGFVCTTAGTPGTWKTFGAITA